MKRKNFLGEFEELVLLAILKLGNEGYGVNIAETVEGFKKKRISIGALYTTLTRLEEKGFVRSWLGEATEERGGRAKKYYAIEAPGLKALKEIHTIRTEVLEKVELVPQLA